MRSLRELLVTATERQRDLGYVTIDGTTLTYGEHLAAVASTAHALRDRYGIGPGDRVAILAANCPEWAIAFWAVTTLGGVVCAGNGWWTTDEVRHALELTEPKLVIGDARRLERVAPIGSAVPTVEIETGFAALTTHAPGAELPDPPIGEDDPALILFTSGTTGRAKGALISHRALVAFVQVLMCSGAVRMRTAMLDGTLQGPPSAPPPSTTLMLSPMFHVSGLFAGIIMGLATGGRMVLRRGRFDPADVLRLIAEERVTNWTPIGGTGPLVLDHPAFPTADVSTVTMMGFGGGPTSPALRERLKKGFPNAASSHSNGYGSSETVVPVSSNNGVDYDRFPTSAGIANPTCELAIMDEAGRRLPDGVEGEIHVRSAYNMLGYWGNPEATAKAFKEPGHWLATGDIGAIEGGRLFINSRARDMILRSGENIYPIEVEQRLDAHPAVRECAVVGADHPVHGQEVKAIVVLAPGETATDEELAAFAPETLAPYKVPTSWERRPDPLPRNASGKVLKTVLLGEAAAPEEVG
jgi:acyl-CoA synthetase (AMP-forming)/AMP-acid ligase II